VQFPNPVGKRTVYYCESPDLDLFPKTWHANTVRFRAGLELSILNGMLASLSKARRLFGLRRLPQWASFLAWTSQLLLPFGSRCGALGVWLGGLDYADEVIQRRIALVTDSDGPAIPVAPACVLARSLLDRGPAVTGAFACDGLITLDEIMTHLRDKRVWLVHGSGDRWEDHRT
jgi:hypothetical protein